MATTQVFDELPDRTKEQSPKLTMQAFHYRLFQLSEVDNPEFKVLSQLTQATSTQMRGLTSDLGWNDWDSKAA